MPTMKAPPNWVSSSTTIWLVTGGVWLAVIFGAVSGFDVTDEGVYYLSAMHPVEVPDRQTTYFYFARALFAATGHSLLLTRCVIAALLLGATLLLSRGVSAFLSNFAPALKLEPWLGVATVSATALSFSISPVAPSYNLLNAIALLAAAGLMLSAAAPSPAQDRRRGLKPVYLLGACVVIVGLDFFIKFSTSAVLAVGFTVFFLLTSRESWRRKILLLLSAPVAGLLLGLGYFAFIERFAVWREGIGGTLGGLTTGTYLRDELIRYARDIQGHAIETLWAYADVCTTVLVTGGILLCLRAFPRVQRALAAAGFLVVAVSFALNPLSAESLQLNGSAGSRIYLGALAVLGLAVAATFIVRKRPGDEPRSPVSWRLWPLVVLLLVLPYAGGFGTTNAITQNSVYQVAPWFALIALAAAFLAHAWRARWLPPLCVIPVAAVALTQFFNGYWNHPYRLPGGRAAQTEPTVIGAPTYASTLRLDPASHQFIEATRAQLSAHGFHPGDDVFAFFNLPGLVFAVGGVSPGHPWYFAGDQNSLDLNAMRVASVSPARRARAFVITNGDATPFYPQLRTAGLDFPAAYVRCGEPLKNPLTQEPVEIWRPR